MIYHVVRILKYFDSNKTVTLLVLLILPLS